MQLDGNEKVSINNHLVLIEFSLETKKKVADEMRHVSIKSFKRRFNVKVKESDTLSIEKISAKLKVDMEGFGYIELTLRVVNNKNDKIVWRTVADYDMYLRYQQMFDTRSKTGEIVIDKEEHSECERVFQNVE